MAKEGMINLPPGFRFMPRDDELINYYLKPRILGQKLPCDIINEDVPVYGPQSTPWLLFDINNPNSWVDSNTNPEKAVYVFTSLSKIAAADSNTTTRRTRKNTSKKAGCGTWMQRSPRLPIIDGAGDVIGGKRMMNFEIQEFEDGFDIDNTVYFKMHEYTLWGVNDNLASDDLVLCQITFDPRKKSQYKLPDQVVPRRGRKPQNKKQSNTSTTSENVPVICTNVCQESTSSLGGAGVGSNENMDEFCKGLFYDDQGGEGICFNDIGVPNLDDFGGFFCSDDQGSEGLCFGDQSGEDLSLDFFDISGFVECMNSNPEVAPLEDRTFPGLGKRKSAGIIHVDLRNCVQGN